ncbi:adenylate/guanylate cyclase domain-containing protein [Mycobacterium sp. 21AC1]|uniref:adenylate/guanylate cyclase domain-containing protein n=1 Tax=[Mycobacterium] appelbergii TaxID=2939269 RepID=UPI0029394EB0|nr:adenylate/guanylate cyclase domain-containing protein [Mycobacterium sp. 21AC1]MDV3127856.1 adenylate/guanylate cyclase domain-containing protein [Mycobacterium sp. 21AC1]
MTGPRRASVDRLAVNYAVRLTLAHLTAAAAVLLVIVSLSGNTVGDARELLTTKNLIGFIALVTFSAVLDAVLGVINMRPTFRWFATGEEPTAAQQRAAVRIPVRQTAVEFTVWIISGAVFMVLNLDAQGGVAYVIGGSILFGAMITACVGFLITSRTLRPIIAAAMKDSTGRIRLPGALGRLVYVWVLFTAVPSVGIWVIVLARSNGWFLQSSASIDTPILVMAAVSVLLGFAATILVARSISDPVHEVVVAMTEVERGRVNTAVAVYEPSEIGRLQSGFNRMVAGLAERERLRDLFGRYVGVDVARRALQQDGAVGGDVREVAVLYVDLVGSTALAASRPPEELATLLNGFFKIVVDTVEQHHGLINKFEGDAVLAAFGAPLRLDNPASAAMAAARALVPGLRRLPDVEFGVGISCGTVFAGNIGAENRYEYTVIGDSVNEAARLADHAKDRDVPVLCSAGALARADTDESRRWVVRGSTVLRGRSTVTVFAEPSPQ